MAITTPAAATTQKFVLIKDRVEYYQDFTLNLLYYIHKYYIDKVSLCNDIDIEHHFSFCYNKVCDEFKQEGIDFSDNKDLKKYMYDYYYEYLYRSDRFQTNLDLPLNDYVNQWKNIFNIEGMKNKAIINLLVDIYLKFDKTIEKKII